MREEKPLLSDTLVMGRTNSATLSGVRSQSECVLAVAIMIHQIVKKVQLRLILASLLSLLVFLYNGNSAEAA